MTQEEKAKAYDEAIEKARAFNNGEDVNIEAGTTLCEYIFPELKESEDEKISKELIDFINRVYERQALIITDEEKDNWITWLENQDKHSIYNVPSREVILAIWDLGNEWKELTNGCISTKYGTQLNYIQKHWEESEYYLREKQDEQKPTDKVEPKFNKGDWITNANGNYTWKVISVDDLDYTLQNQWGECVEDTVDYVNKAFHLWTIEDAKDGDIVCYKDEISIYKYDIKNYEKTLDGFIYYCCYDGKRFIMNSFYYLTEQDKANIHPATKEQHDLLFTKIKEAGYEWNADKKVLKKEEVK